MLALFLSWLLIGLLTGLLANGAKLRPPFWQRQGWLKLIAVAILAALLGGLLGTLILGQEFATPTALWVAVLAVILLPKSLVWLLKYRESHTIRRSL